MDSEYPHIAFLTYAKEFADAASVIVDSGRATGMRIAMSYLYGHVRIPLNVATCSISKLPLVPSQSCHLIQAKLPPRRSVATRFGYYDWAFSDLPPLALTFRMDSPFSAMR